MAVFSLIDEIIICILLPYILNPPTLCFDEPYIQTGKISLFRILGISRHSNRSLPIDSASRIQLLSISMAHQHDLSPQGTQFLQIITLKALHYSLKYNIVRIMHACENR